MVSAAEVVWAAQILELITCTSWSARTSFCCPTKLCGHRSRIHAGPPCFVGGCRLLAWYVRKCFGGPGPDSGLGLLGAAIAMLNDMRLVKFIIFLERHPDKILVWSRGAANAILKGMSRTLFGGC